MARVRQRVAKSETPEARKVSRLSNIVVEEVSIVDKPANQRVFLVVKSDGTGAAGGQPATPPVTPPVTPPPAAVLKVSPADKVKYTTALKAIEAKVAEISKALEGAEAAEGAATPEAITKAFADIGQLLGIEVEKAGRKISATRLEAMRQAHILLGQVIAEADPEPAAEPAAKSADPPAGTRVLNGTGNPARPAPVDAGVATALKEMTETMGVLVKAVGVQKKRIDELATSDGGSRQVPVEKAGEHGDGDEPPAQSWPIDMNRPFKRDTTPVEKSFFAS
jgi:hypothetical protein